MTTTPHPTDTLPLPEPNTDFGKWEHYTADQIRAARREGYELAMSSSLNPDEWRAIVKSLGAALKRLTFAARTTGGTAGPDAELMSTCEQAENVLTMKGIDDALAAPTPSQAAVTELETQLADALEKAISGMRLLLKVQSDTAAEYAVSDSLIQALAAYAKKAGVATT